MTAGESLNHHSLKRARLTHDKPSIRLPAARFFMKRLLFSCVLTSFGLQPASALIANLPSRTTVSLDGAWQAIVDPFDNGRSDSSAIRSRTASAITWSIVSMSRLLLNVPGDWNTQRDS